MINLDINNLPRAARVFLCKTDNTVICELNGIEPDSGSMKVNLNNQNELEFDYYRYIDDEGEGNIQSNGYDALQIGMRLFVEGFGYFKIKYPPYTDDGAKESKHITAYSIENELEDKDLISFKINTGEESSMENLVQYENGETEDLLNPYTGLPYDYIVFYNTFPAQLEALKTKYGDGILSDQDSINEWVEYCKLIPRLENKPTKDNDGNITSVTEYVKFNYNAAGTAIESVTLTNISTRLTQLITFYTKYRSQLSLLDLAIANSGCQWTIGSVDSSIVNKRFQFDIDGQNIYSFLTQDAATQSKCLAWFDYVNFTINYKSIDALGEDSGVILDRQSLLNNINVSVSEDKIITRYNVSGGSDLDLLDVNFGTNRIVNIDYYINAKNDNGERIYVSDSLATKYEAYKSDIEKAREVYISTAKSARQKEKDITEIKYRVPNDIVQTDWGTFKSTELQAALTQYTNMLATLKTLYKEDYPNGVDANQAIIESVIKTTIYWHDYYAYQQAITQINAAIAALPNGNYDDIDDATILAQINAWETEWSLFGTIELQNKILAYKEKLSVLADNNSVVLATDGTAKAWSSLTTAEQANYADSNSYNSARTEYNKLFTEMNNCKSYLDTLQTSVDTMQAAYDSLVSTMNQMKVLVTLSGYNRQSLHELVSDIPNTALSFTAAEIRIITGLYTDRNYQNTNILRTSVDDIVSVIDTERELLEDAKEQLSIDSQPQFTFSTNIDNVLIMPEFQGYKFEVGNYAYVQYYDEYYVKLRLDTISFNPFAPEGSINVTFTNYTTSNSQRSDLSYILKESSSGGSGGSSGGGGSSGDGFGSSDKIDVTLSNTMLAKLLNTEMFGSRVTDVILDTLKLNNLNARYATFGSLAGGTTTIDGSCIKTGVIKSNNYNGTESGGTYSLTNTAGSILELLTGTFSFGGGKLKFDGTTMAIKGSFEAGSDSQTKINADGTLSFGGGKLTYANNVLSVEGDIKATSLSIGGKTSLDHAHNGLFINSSGNLRAGSSGQTQINADGTFSFGGGKLTYSNNTLTIDGTINAGTIGGWHISTNGIYDNTSSNSVVGININGKGAAFYAGAPSTDYNGTWDVYTGNDAAFLVYHDGSMYASQATIGASGTSSGGSDTIIQLSDGRVRTDSPDGYYSFPVGNDDYYVSFRACLECGELQLTGSYTTPKYWDETPKYWATLNGCELSFNKFVDGDSYTSYFHLTTITGGAGLWCGVQASFDSYIIDKNGNEITGSDRNIKNSITNLDEKKTIEFIYSLSPVKFKYNSGTSNRYHHGLIAQSVHELMYEDWGLYCEVEPDKYSDGFSALRYSELIPDIITTIQYQKKQIDELQQTVQELKGE